MPIVTILAPARVFSASPTAQHAARSGICHVVRRFEMRKFWEKNGTHNRSEAYTLCGKWIPYRWTTDQEPRPCKLCEKSTCEDILTGAFVVPPIPVGWYISHVGKPPICDDTGDARGLRAGTSPRIRPA